MLFFRLNATTGCINQYFTPFLEREGGREKERCSQFLVSKSKPLVYFVSVEKTNPMYLTKCILHMCKVCFPSRPFLGWVDASRASGPWLYLWPSQLSAAFAWASCYELSLVGTGGLCVVCSPANLLGVLQTSLPSPTGGGAAGECQAVALAIWVQPLRGLGPGPFINYPPLLSSSLSLNWE